MSEHATHGEAHAGHHGPATPVIDFDNQEVASFDKLDGSAITKIGIMLVCFFLYSLGVMAAVTYWTSRAPNTEEKVAHAIPAEHDDDEAEAPH